MSYIRAKNINGRSYLYLVESKREGGRVVQKHIKYLGPGSKADIPAKMKELDFYVPPEVKGKEWREKLYGKDRPPLKQKLGTTKTDQVTGSGWGSREQGTAVQSLDGVNKGDIILVYNEELNAKNMMLVTEVDREKGNLKGYFVDPKDPSKKRLEGDKTLNVWEDDLKDGNYFKQKLDPDYTQEQLRIGTKVELEHTKDPKIAEGIAIDHLKEHPDYYKELAKMEKKLGTTDNKKEPKEKKEISYLDQRAPEVKSEYANINDLDFKTLERAHNNTSFSPDLRARQQQNDYVREIDSFSNRLMNFAETPEQKEQALKEIDRYKEGYKSKVMALMGAKSRTLSPMITGPAKFPTKRNEKAMDVEHKRLTELLEYRKKAENKAFSNVKVAHPDGITHYETKRLKSTVDSDIATIKAIDEKKEGYTYYSRSTWSGSLAGKIRRKIKNGDYETAIATYDHIQKAEKKAGIKPVFKSNNRIHKEISDIRGKKAPAKATGTSTVKTYKTAKVINNREADRVQIFFDDIPSTEIRTDLKARGFRWSRREGAWQRKNTRDGLYMSTTILDKHLEPVIE